MPNEPNRADQALRRPGRGRALPRRLLAVAGLALLVTAGVIGGYVLLRDLAADGNACELTDDPPASDDPLHRPKLFVGWGQPDLALLVSGQMHGYMFPCGCSDPQNGGLVRRLTLINELKAKGWEVVGVDVGELPPNPGAGIPRQSELKLEYTMKALDLLGYRAVGLGKTEMTMPLLNALSQYSINKPHPRPVNSTLEIDQAGKVFQQMNVRPYEILPGSPRIGVASLFGPDLEDSLKERDNTLKFHNNQANVLPKLYQAFANQKVEMAVLLHHEYALDPVTKGLLPALAMDRRRREMAVALAKEWEAARKKDPAIPPLQLLLVLTEEPEPPGMLQLVAGTPTHLLDIGHKGKYVGVVGVYKQGGALRLKYELVQMAPKYKPQPGQPNAVADLLEQYARQVRDEGLLKQFDFLRSPHPLQVDPYVKQQYGGSTFVGTARCAKCHKAEVQVWQGTKHATDAFKALVNAKEPSLRHFDPECIICHTVGFKHPEGYNDLPPDELRGLIQNKAGKAQVQAAIAQRNPKFEHVGCENCHGPGSAHANGDSTDTKLYPLINPFRPSEAERGFAQQMNIAPNAAVRQQAAQQAKRLFERRMDRLNDFCQKCHDLENDVNWSKVPFLQKWTEIMHNDPANVGTRWLPPRPVVAVPVGAKKKR